MISDVLVIGIMVIFIMAGYRRGFVKAMFRIFSKVISIVMAVKFYRPVTSIIEGSKFFSKLIFKLSGKIKFMLGDGNITGSDVADAILDRMHVPNTIKVSVLSDLPYNINIMDKAEVANVIASKIGMALLQIFGMIAVFIVVRLVLFIVKVILDKVFHLPVLNQMNKIAGVLFGTIEGIIMVYIVMSIVVVINNDRMIASIDHSLIARYFYYNNVLLALM